MRARARGGWGDDAQIPRIDRFVTVSFAGFPVSVLQKAAVRLINSTVCKTLMSDEVSEGMLCAGVLTGGVDACQVMPLLPPA